MVMELFYTIACRKIDKPESFFEIQLNKEHPIFKGHFPRDPIVPGVLLLSILKDLIQESIDEKGDFQFKFIRSLKFLKPIIPGNHLLNFKLTCYQEPFKIQAEVFVEGSLCMKMDSEAEVANYT